MGSREPQRPHVLLHGLVYLAPVYNPDNLNVHITYPTIWLETRQILLKKVPVNSRVA